MKIANPLTYEERINLALDMMSRARELEPRFGPVWCQWQLGALELKIAEIRREKVMT